MEFLLFLSPLLLIAYLFWVYKKYGMTHSISATYPKLAKAEKWMFGTMWVAYVAPIVLLTADHWFILAALMLALVIANPNYWDKEGAGDNLHYYGSYGTVAFGYVGLIFMDYLTGAMITIAFILFALGLEINFKVFAKIKNDTYWQEVFAGLSIPITLYLIL